MITDVPQFGGELRQRGFRMAPEPEGDQSNKGFTRNFRHAFDKAGAPSRLFDGISGKKKNRLAWPSHSGYSRSSKPPFGV